MSESFARVETKYLLSLSGAEQAEKELRRRGFVRMDFGSPRIQSLYYDTQDYALVRASLEHPVYKEKLRLRVYGEPGTITRSFVEIKKKYRGTVYKRRTEMPLREAGEGLARARLPQETGQVGREAEWMLRRYGLRPAAVIACEREAWVGGEASDVRITFDRAVTFRDWEMDLNLPVPGLPLLEEDVRLVEIKTGGACPLWLAGLLRDTGARRTHFSKYGTAYRDYIRQEKGNEGGAAECSPVFLRVGA